MFDLTSGNLTPVVNFEGISKNVMTVGFQVGDKLNLGQVKTWFEVLIAACEIGSDCNLQAEGRGMFTGGEDCTARIWDLKMRNLSCQVSCWTNIILQNMVSQDAKSLWPQQSPYHYAFHSESSKRTPR